MLLGEDGAPFLESGKPKAYLIRGKSWVNNHAHVLRGMPGLLNAFLLYQLNNIEYRPYVSGTTRLKLPQGPMKQIPLLVPGEAEQRRIVAEIEKQFTRLEAGVAALRRVQANLKRYRAAVLKAACEGRLVPTEAELAKAGNRKANFETGEALLARILTERRQNWQGRGQYKEPAAPDTTQSAAPSRRLDVGDCPATESRQSTMCVRRSAARRRCSRWRAVCSSWRHQQRQGETHELEANFGDDCGSVSAHETSWWRACHHACRRNREDGDHS